MDLVELALKHRCDARGSFANAIQCGNDFISALYAEAEAEGRLDEVASIMAERLPGLVELPQAPSSLILPGRPSATASVTRSSLPMLVNVSPDTVADHEQVHAMEQKLGPLSQSHKELLTNIGELEVLLFRNRVWQRTEAARDVAQASEEIHEYVLQHVFDNWREQSGTAGWSEWPVFTKSGELFADDLKDPNFILLSRATDAEDAIFAAYHLRNGEDVPVFWIDWMDEINCVLMGKNVKEAVCTLVNYAIQSLAQGLLDGGIRSPLAPNVEPANFMFRK